MPAAKAPAKSVKKAASKSVAKSSPKTLAGVVAQVPDANRRGILQDYEKAVSLMQQGKYAAAHPALEKLLASAPPEFVDRIRMYLSACISQARKGDAKFSSAEEKYDYAISLLNDGQYEDARQHLEEIVGGDANADYGFYGLAVLASMTGDTQSCLEKLTEAIRLKTQNRIQARSDSDFSNMNDDPRFTELLYPDA